MKIANQRCPITLERLDETCFVFKTKSGVGRAYDRNAFEKYMISATNFVDPVSREPLKCSDIAPVFPKFHQKYTQLMSRLFVESLFQELKKKSYAAAFINYSLLSCDPEIFDVDVSCVRFCIGMIYMCSKPKYRSICRIIEKNIKKYNFSNNYTQKALKKFTEIKEETELFYSFKYLKFNYIGNQITPDIRNMEQIS